jgi:acetyl-CoA carboxylase biotin carboxyl carrier protein
LCSRAISFPSEEENVLDLHDIQALADLVKNSHLHELEIEREGVRLRIVNDTAAVGVPHHGEHSVGHGERAGPPLKPEDDGAYHLIRSPIVGTFYGASSPDAPDFVTKGDAVDASSVVCIIEAMKVMNEIQAEVAGVVTEVLAQNGQPVEFGQPLFKVKKV